MNVGCWDGALTTFSGLGVEDSTQHLTFHFFLLGGLIFATSLTSSTTARCCSTKVAGCTTIAATCTAATAFELSHTGRSDSLQFVVLHYDAGIACVC